MAKLDAPARSRPAYHADCNVKAEPQSPLHAAIAALLDSEIDALLTLLARFPLYRELATLTAHDLDLALCEEMNRRNDAKGGATT